MEQRVETHSKACMHRLWMIRSNLEAGSTGRKVKSGLTCVQNAHQTEIVYFSLYSSMKAWSNSLPSRLSAGHKAHVSSYLRRIPVTK